MDEKNLWNTFCKTGKIGDYISYVNSKKDGASQKVGVENNADKDKGTCVKAEEYR